MTAYRLPPVSPARKALAMTDYIEAARELQCTVPQIMAVSDVESAGGGFLMDGRPKILFEAHRFSKLTGGAYNTSNPNISSSTWNKKLYKGGVGEYSRLMEAIRLDPMAALKSASWGRFQILGSNHPYCGFPSVESYVLAMFESEGEQLDAFVTFVKSKKLDGFLRTSQWASFAKGYNGISYKANKYDTRLIAAEAKYKRIRGEE